MSCICPLIWLGIMLLVGASPPLKPTNWLKQTTQAYRQATARLVAPSVGNVSVEVWLEREYRQHNPHSIEATAIAYWGALRTKNVESWVKRMTPVADMSAPALTQEADALEFLPQVLERIYRQRRAPQALRELIGMHLDGHYQENLNYVRHDLLLRRPRDFASPLRDTPSELPWTAGRLQENGFTEMLIFTLGGDADLRRRMASTLGALSRSRSEPSVFMRRYFTYVLKQVRPNKA